MLEPTAWIGAVTSLAGLVKSWLEARKSGVDLEKARTELSKAKSGTSLGTLSVPLVPSAEREEVRGMVISDSLLRSLIQDIEKAQARFVACFDDPRYSPADIDKEQEIAKRSVCAHLRRIQEFNAGTLPTQALRDVCVSFRCEA